MQQSATSVWETTTARQLSGVLADIDNVQMMQNFLRDVMTEKEIIEISSRLEAARMLKQGKRYTEIIEQTKLSSRTIARISDWMQNGQSGYESALSIIETRHAHMSPDRAE
jgi:TrpR-related protein YerC/YecD